MRMTGMTAALLITGVDQGVQRQRILIGRRALFLHQRTEHARLRGRQHWFQTVVAH
jgi:hypothetical protein